MKLPLTQGKLRRSHTASRKAKEEGSQFVQYFAPLLNALRGLGGSGTPDEVVERIANDLKLSDELQNELLPSGQPRFRNQVAWARFYLVREGLLDSSKRGVWSLTERGRSTTLSLDQAREIFKVSSAFPRGATSEDGSTPNPLEVAQSTGVTPGGYRNEVIDLLLKLPPSGFERLSQRLLREAGFIQVIVTGSRGDGGIDGYGTLQINLFVSFKVLFQCKRYTKSVSPSHVRDFRGAMAGRADKGMIITTGTFTAEARREASRDGVPPIEIIDGDKLVAMLQKLELGLKPVTTYVIDEAFLTSSKTNPKSKSHKARVWFYVCISRAVEEARTSQKLRSVSGLRSHQQSQAFLCSRFHTLLHAS